MSEPTDHFPRQEVTDLLTAIVTALDVPDAAHEEDDRRAAFTLQSRIAYVRGCLSSLVHGEAAAHPRHATAAIRQIDAHHPIAYAPMTPHLKEEDGVHPEEAGEAAVEAVAQ